MASQYSSNAGWNSGVWYSAMRTRLPVDNRVRLPMRDGGSRTVYSGLDLLAASGGSPHTSTGRMRVTTTSASAGRSRRGPATQGDRGRRPSGATSVADVGDLVVEPGPPELPEHGVLDDLGPRVEGDGAAIVGGRGGHVRRSPGGARLLEQVGVDVGPRPPVGQRDGGGGEAVAARVAAAPHPDVPSRGRPARRGGACPSGHSTHRAGRARTRAPRTGDSPTTLGQVEVVGRVVEEPASRRRPRRAATR